MTRVPLVVVGNKCDLESARQVTSVEAAAFAKSLGAVYLEASARLRANVDEAFHALVRDVRRRHQPTPAAAAAAAGARRGAAR